MARKLTIPQIESNIDNKVLLEMIEYLQLLEQKINNNAKTNNDNFQLIVSAIEGTDRAVAHIGKPLGPLSAAPAHPNNFDWYFNKTDKTFYMFVDGSWVKLTTLEVIIDLSDYYTKTQADNTFISGKFGEISELYDEMTGKDVPGSGFSAISIEDEAKLYKNQDTINKNFLSDLEDNVIFVNADEIQYIDTKSLLKTVKANIITAGNNITYSTLISPYDRISQVGANFEATLNKEMSVEYQFISKAKSLKFAGTPGQTYKWEHIQKVEDKELVDYIRFSGTAKLTMNEAFIPGLPGTYKAKTLPFDLKLSDLMDSTQGKAIVEMDFTVKPIADEKLLKINYLTSAIHYDNRLINIIRGIDTRIKNTEAEANVYSYPLTVGGFNNIILSYKPADHVAKMKAGEVFLLDLEVSSIILPTLNDTMTVLMQDESKVTTDPAANFASLEPFLYGPHANAGDKAAFAHARHWDYFKNKYEDFFLVVRKAEDFDGSTIWVPDGWKPKPQKPGDMQVVSRKVPADQFWHEYQLSDTAKKLVYVEAINTKQIESNASAYWQDSQLVFVDGRAVAAVSTNADKQFKLTINGVEIWQNGSLHRTKPYSEWSSWKLFELKGKAFVEHTTANVEKDITSWLDVGTGHQNEVLGFNAAGKAEFKTALTETLGDQKYDEKTFDFLYFDINAGEKILSGVRNIDIIPPLGMEPIMPFDIDTDILAGQNVYVHPVLAPGVVPQDNDFVLFNGQKIFRQGFRLKWIDVKNYFGNYSFKFKKQVVGTDTQWVWNGVQWNPNSDTKDVYAAISAEEVARIQADDEIWNKLNTLGTGGKFAEVKLDDNDFPDVVDTVIISGLWTAQTGSTPVNTDHMEVMANDLSKYALYTFDGTKWIKGAERNTHIKSGVTDLSPVYNAIDAEEVARVNGDNEIWVELDLDDTDLKLMEAVVLPTAI